MRFLFWKKHGTCMYHLASNWWHCQPSRWPPAASWAWTRPGTGRARGESCQQPGLGDQLLTGYYSSDQAAIFSKLRWKTHKATKKRIRALSLRGPKIFRLPSSYCQAREPGNFEKAPPQRISCQSGLRHPIEMKFCLVHLNTHSCRKT